MAKTIECKRRYLCVAIAAALGLFSCKSTKRNTAYPGHENDFGPGYDVLAEFSEAVGSYDYFEQDSSLPYRRHILQQIKKIMLPQKDVLHRQALWRWNKIPMAKRMDTAGWVSVSPEDKMPGWTAFWAASLFDRDEAARFFHSWNAVQMFRFIRQALLLRNYPASIAARVITIDAITAPFVVRLNNDGEKPVLAVQREREFFLVEFEYDEDSKTYSPNRFEWLVPDKNSRGLHPGDDEPKTAEPEEASEPEETAEPEEASEPVASSE